jgi:hypothetical protein
VGGDQQDANQRYQENWNPNDCRQPQPLIANLALSLALADQLPLLQLLASRIAPLIPFRSRTPWATHVLFFSE